MQELATTQDARISQYSFGQSISQFGVTVYSCKFAKQGKKIFGNDPDPTKEIILAVSYTHLTLPTKRIV